MIVANALRLPYRDQSAHFACCSPPYYMKRRYAGVEPREWPRVSYSPMPGLPRIHMPALRWKSDTQMEAICGQGVVVDVSSDAGILGLEPDPFAYIGHLILIAREAWRVLRDDGVWAVNLGDTYSGSTQTGGTKSPTLQSRHSNLCEGHGFSTGGRVAPGYKPKDLMLIPARFALAMIADGWTLRSRMPGGEEMRPDVIWKKNAMPESVRDRPSVDFEDVLIFSKGRRYSWDQENGRTAYRPMGGQHSGGFQGQAALKPRGNGPPPLERYYGAGGANMRAAWDLPRRETWKINTEATDEEHYAAWPRELVRRLIKIGTSDKGCCPECGAQWVRQVKRTRTLDGEPVDAGSWKVDEGTNGAQGVGHWRFGTKTEDLGWTPSCDCGAGEPAPCRVLDPFSGIGRTGEVCYETGRIYMPAELSVSYAAIQERRLRDHRAVRRGEALPPRKAATISGPLFRKWKERNEPCAS